MRNHKVFQVCYTLNFIICLIISGFGAYKLFANFNLDVSTLILYSILFMATALYAIFDWYCYQLVEKITADVPLPEPVKNTGEILKNICLVISVLFIFWILSFVMETIFEVQSRLFNFKKYFIGYCFIGVTITSLYLCITYRTLVKQLDINITDSIELFGIEE